MNNHTPTPWKAAESFSGWKITDANGVLIAGDINNGPDMGEADAKRIVECVNAFHDHKSVEARTEACKMMDSIKVGDLSAEAIGRIKADRDKLKADNDEMLELLKQFNRYYGKIQVAFVNETSPYTRMKAILAKHNQ